MRLQSVSVTGLTFLLALVATWPARAGDPTLAEALFRDGKSLMLAKAYAQACPKLRESYAQDPATGTLLALALCYEEAGKLASAWTTYSLLASRAQQQAQPAREQAGRERGDALTPRLSKLTIRVPAEVALLPGLVVERDGEQLPRPAWGAALPSDGGQHVIVVSADGKKTWRTVVTLSVERDYKVVHVPLLAALPVSAALSFSSPPAVGEEGTNPFVGVAVLTGSAGLVALGVGTVFGLKAQAANRASKEDNHCDSQSCDATGMSLRDDAFTYARASTALFLTGGALVAAGVGIYLVGDARVGARSMRLTPAASTASRGLQLNGQF